MTNFTIKIVSDTVCPWCYIGKKRLDKAIELYKKVYPGGKDDTFTVSWYPFYLDVTSPKKGVPILERFLERYGPERSPAMQERLRNVGWQEGINFSFENKIGNTRDSHRLIQLGKTKGNEVENRVVLELFKDYFEGPGDITSYETLIRVGVNAGLDQEEVKEWLEKGEGGEEVDAEVQEAVRKNTHGVPNFTIQDKYEVDGAQDPQAFMEVFVKVKEEGEG